VVCRGIERGDAIRMIDEGVTDYKARLVNER
jgi:hypothetical protein